jgi:hypothetical protein
MNIPSDYMNAKKIFFTSTGLMREHHYLKDRRSARATLCNSQRVKARKVMIENFPPFHAGFGISSYSGENTLTDSAASQSLAVKRNSKAQPDERRGSIRAEKFSQAVAHFSGAMTPFSGTYGHEPADFAVV